MAVRDVTLVTQSPYELLCASHGSDVVNRCPLDHDYSICDQP